eukprot:8136435-Pyramimonas_sp.AAC.1
MAMPASQTWSNGVQLCAHVAAEGDACLSSERASAYGYTSKASQNTPQYPGPRVPTRTDTQGPGVV